MELSDNRQILLNVTNKDLGNSTFVIPDSVASIGRGAFRNCTGLTQIILPDGLTSIVSCAFLYCTGLTQIILPDGVTSIGSDAFCGCTGLTQITLPDSLASIGEYAFYSCNRLTQITLQDGVTSIGDGAFMGCNGLTQITLPDNLASIGDYAFNGCTKLQKIIINTKSIDEVKRIKNLFPEEHRHKVIQNPVYNEVLEARIKKADIALKPIIAPINNFVNALQDGPEKLFGLNLIIALKEAKTTYCIKGDFKVFNTAFKQIFEDTLKNTPAITAPPSWANEKFKGLLKKIANVIVKACRSSKDNSSSFFKTKKHLSAKRLGEKIGKTLGDLHNPSYQRNLGV